MAVPFAQSMVCPVTVGRAATLDALQACFKQVHSGKGQTILLTGEAGIGKSRLVAEAKQIVTPLGFRVLQGNCFEPDRSLPYAPLIDLLRSQLGIQVPQDIASVLGPTAHELAELLPELAHLLPARSLAHALSPELEKQRLFTALGQFFTRLSVACPLLIVIEDLHWSDDISLEFLLYLARACTNQPLFLLATYRSDEVHPILRHWLTQLDRTHLSRDLSVTRLTAREVDTMLRAIFALGRPVRAEFLQAIYALTDGNPFFIEEVLKALMASGDIFYVDGVWDRKPLQDLRPPRSVQDAVWQRLDRLSKAARQMLALAAVAGRRFNFAVLQQLTGADEAQLVVLMKEVIAAHLVIEESVEQFAFRHALTREAIYAQLLARERRALHQRIAETIEQIFAASLEPYWGELAYHCSEAHLWPKVLLYAQHAGERAYALGAPRVAIDHFSNAVNAAHQLAITPPPSLYLLRWQAYEMLGEFEAALRDYEQALAVAQTRQEGRLQWQSLMALSYLWGTRNFPRRAEYLTQALAVANTLADPRLHATSLSHQGNFLALSGRAAEGVAFTCQALEIFKVLEDKQGMAEALRFLAMNEANFGDMVSSFEHMQQAVALLRLVDKPWNLSEYLAESCLDRSPCHAEIGYSALGKLADCLRDTEEGLQLARQADWPVGEAHVHLCASIALAAFGEFGAGVAHGLEAVRISGEIQHPRRLIGSHGYLGQVYFLMLESDLAIQHLEISQQLEQQLTTRWWSGNNTAYLALSHLQKHDLAIAQAVLEATLPWDQSPRNSPERRIIWAWGELALAQDKPKLAVQIANQLIQSTPGASRTQAIPTLLYLKSRALVALHRLGEAEQTLEDAKQGAHERGVRPLLWQIHCALGRLHHRCKREDEARVEFAAAREIVHALAATLDDHLLRQNFTRKALALLPQEKIHPFERPAAPQYGGLSARECEVAAQIAQGKSNRAIAEVLVVTDRTVEVHTTHILTKLGFRSRTQIALWAIEQGLLKSSPK